MEQLLLNQDLNIIILENFTCCYNDFNKILNISKKIKNNLKNHKKFINIQNNLNYNMMEYYKYNYHYYKEKFNHIYNSLNITLTQNNILFNENLSSISSPSSSISISPIHHYPTSSDDD